MPLPLEITRLLTFLLSTDDKPFNENIIEENIISLVQGLNNSLPSSATYVKLELTTHYAIAAHLLEIQSITESNVTPLTLCGPKKGKELDQEIMLLLCNTQQIEWKAFDIDTQDVIDKNYSKEFSHHLILNYFFKRVINSTGEDIFESLTFFPIHTFNKIKHFVFFKFLQIPLEKFDSHFSDLKLVKFFERLQKKQVALAKTVIPAILDQLPDPLFDELGVKTVTTLAREATKTISETHIDSIIFDKIRAATPYNNNPTKVVMLFNLIQDNSLKLTTFQLNFTKLEQDISLQADPGLKKFYSDHLEATFNILLSKGNIPNHLYTDIYQIYWIKINIYSFFNRSIFITFFSKGLPPNTSLEPERNYHILQHILSHNYPTNIKFNYIQLCIQYKNNIANPDERNQYFLNELKAFIINRKNVTEESFSNKIKIVQNLYAALDQNEFKIKALQFIFQELTLYLQLINSPQDATTIFIAKAQSPENRAALLSTALDTLLEATPRNTIPNEILNSFYQSYWTTLSQASKQLDLLSTYLNFLPGFFAHGLPANTPISCFDNQTILQRCTADDIDSEIGDKLFQFIIKGSQRNKENIPNVIERDHFFFEVLKLILQKLKGTKFYYKSTKSRCNFFLSLASTIETPILRTHIWDLLLLEKLPAIFYVALMTNYNKLDKVEEIIPTSSFSESDNGFLAICDSKSCHKMDELIFKLLHTATQPLDNIFIEYLGNLITEGTTAKKLVLDYIETLNTPRRRTAYALATGDAQSNSYRFFHISRGILRIKDNDLIEAMEANLKKIRNDEQLPDEQLSLSHEISVGQIASAAPSTQSAAASFSDFFKSFSLSSQHKDTIPTKDIPLTAEYSENEEGIELAMLTTSDSEDEKQSRPSSPRFHEDDDDDESRPSSPRFS